MKRRRVESVHSHPLQPHSLRQTSSSSSFFHLRPLDPNVPITTTVPHSPDGPICLESNRIYTVGRSTSRCCDISFAGIRCISRRHCQFLLDGFRRRLLIADGAFMGNGLILDEAKQCSVNGVFVNGRRICKGSLLELYMGDEVSLACGNKAHHGASVRCGFIVERVAYFNAHQMPDEMMNGVSTNLRVQSWRYEDPIEKAATLLSLCRKILMSVDPIMCIRRDMDLNRAEKLKLGVAGTENAVADAKVLSDAKEINSTFKLTSKKEVQLPPQKSDDSLNQEDCSNDIFGNFSSAPAKSIDKDDRSSLAVHDTEHHPHFSDGKTFILNRLEFMDSRSPESSMTISLPQLFYPLGSLMQVFIATFTCDVPWFLSSCEMPKHLPITIACHNADRCWSPSLESRISLPYSDYPNLVLIYPRFPDVIAFGKDHKRKGVGCHHPKLFVLQREASMRIIVTSANLVSRQWNKITNTVWWQDFPCREIPDYSSIFNISSTHDESDYRRSDFAAQLAMFMASLIIDVPREAHWITELTKYNFDGAFCQLVASVPGIHAKPCLPEKTNYIFSEMETVNAQSFNEKFIGSVQASVVGLSHRFHSASDSNGVELKTLASLLSKCPQSTSGMSEAVLKRMTNIPADTNAISVLVSEMDGSRATCIQLGFLPRDVAKWVAPLSDMGFFSFSAFIFPKEALTAAYEGGNIKVQLVLYIYQGPKFSDISWLIQPEHLAPLCSLLASVQRCLGIWRLEEVLCRYKWPESLETDFVYGSSSIGTSINSQYLAAFSAATGKRSFEFSDSEESDPEWGRWTTNHELKSPSLSVIFPTIERVKNGTHGINSSRFLLAFSEKTWQRLRTSGILHDSVPHPNNRVGYPMHVKVACRRFQSKLGSSAFGWIYSGSHNFSPAAWGHMIHYPEGSKTAGSATKSCSGARLNMCNYELGVIFVFPPPDTYAEVEGNRSNLDDIILPFVMPPPKYKYGDRPATAQAIREAMLLEKESLMAALAVEEMMDEEMPDEEEETTEFVPKENEEEKVYAEMLWSQVDSSDGC